MYCRLANGFQAVHIVYLFIYLFIYWMLTDKLDYKHFVNKR